MSPRPRPSSRTHHTELDHLDHAREEDLKQAAVVMATFAWHAANRDELLPRKAKPVQPEDDDEPATATMSGKGFDHEH